MSPLQRSQSLIAAIDIGEYNNGKTELAVSETES